jgi:hypothetical protein
VRLLQARFSPAPAGKLRSVARDPIAERVAQNNLAFRRANEAIKAKADEYDVSTTIPFLCECATEGCTTVIRLTPSEYEEVRAHPRRFFVCPGHEAADGTAAVVVEQRETYALLEKIDRAGEIVNQDLRAEKADAHG